MTQRKPLSPELAGRIITVHQALESGVSVRRLDATDLDRPIRGVRAPPGASKLAAVSALLSADQAFTGPTAAKLWGMPLPRRMQADPRFWVSTLSRDRTMRRPGIVGVRRSSGAPVIVDGHRVLDPARTWCSLASLLEPHDLVAVADRIVSSSPSSTALAGLEDLQAASRGSRRGSRVLHAALAEVRVGSWSRPESILRIALMRAGVPEPRLNEPVSVAKARRAIPDLAWPEFLVCAEYDGRWHDDPRQRAIDAERHELLVDAGWLVTHIRSGDLFPDPLVAVARVVRRLTSRGYRHQGTIQRAEPHSWAP